MTTAGRDATAAATSERIRRLAEALFAVLLAFFAATLAVAAVDPVLTVVFAEGGIGYTVARTVVQFGGFALAVAVVLAVSNDWRLLEAGIPDRRQAALALGGVLGLLVVQFLALVVIDAMGASTGQNRAITVGAGRPLYYLLMIPVSILVVGPVEELLFRGVVQGGLRRTFGPVVAIGVASLVFGVVHVSGIEGSALAVVLYVAVATLLALLLGYLYEQTGNLVVPALAHGGYNATLFAIQYADTVGIL